MSSDKPMNRRKFFRAGLAELLKPLANVAVPLEELAKQIGKMDEPRPRPAPAPEIRRAENTASYQPRDYSNIPDDGELHFLRPPGARPEEEFTSVCSRCGNCVHACPVHAIQLDPSAARAGGAPYIDPDIAACTMCDELACMTQCPSSALRLVPREEIDLGIAVWDQSVCLRTIAAEPCTMCVDHCPVGPAAIEVSDNHIVVNENHCTGCGSCQNNCPTHPKSITVLPKSKRDAPTAPATA